MSHQTNTRVEGEDLAVPPNPRKLHIALKRAMDVTIGLVLFVFALPLMLLIAGLIVARDGAPVLYVHERIGRNGKPFGCLKFRTMVRDSQARLDELLARDSFARHEWEQKQKLRNDPRILPWIGPLLRSSSLDELPQLWNVLRGDMSLVGPRPVVCAELSRYGLAQHLYTSVRPGLTGPWQIGERSEGEYDDRIRTDVDYVRNWSLRQDFMIILKTAEIVLSGGSKGAY